MEPLLVEGDSGIFELAVDDEIVFSKQQAGHFGQASVLIDLIRERLPRRSLEASRS